MTHAEATTHAARTNAGCNGMSAEVVRILPLEIDPIVVGDNGWDVEITVGEDQ